MPKVVMYTWTYCPFCVRAKRLLNAKGVEVEEINLDGKDKELNELRERTGMRTVPQIFIDEELVGGFSELKALDDEGQLDGKLGI